MFSVNVTRKHHTYTRWVVIGFVEKLQCVTAWAHAESFDYCLWRRVGGMGEGGRVTVEEEEEEGSVKEGDDDVKVEEEED